MDKKLIDDKEGVHDSGVMSAVQNVFGKIYKTIDILNIQADFDEFFIPELIIQTTDDKYALIMLSFYESYISKFDRKYVNMYNFTGKQIFQMMFIRAKMTKDKDFMKIFIDELFSLATSEKRCLVGVINTIGLLFINIDPLCMDVEYVDIQTYREEITTFITNRVESDFRFDEILTELEVTYPLQVRNKPEIKKLIYDTISELFALR